jgi:hypothetical protein
MGSNDNVVERYNFPLVKGDAVIREITPGSKYEFAISVGLYASCECRDSLASARDFMFDEVKRLVGEVRSDAQLVVDNTDQFVAELPSKSLDAFLIQETKPEGAVSR